MRRGAWFQMGDKSQTQVAEHLENATGVGAILSPRDLKFRLATTRSEEYHQYEIELLLDPQFHLPKFTNANFSSYPINEFRQSVSILNQINDRQLDQFAVALEKVNGDLATNAILAPAVIYEAARTDILSLNQRLFQMAKRVGDATGKPTYATVFLGNSVTSSQTTTESILDDITGFSNCDGWYYAFEFPGERLPSNQDYVYRAMECGLALAATGKPVLHAYAGPLGIVSMGFGATGAAIGHSQNLWQLSRGRWEQSEARQGGGGHPARFFSSELWGTIVYPDEVALISEPLRNQLLTLSPYSERLHQSPLPDWSRKLADRHLVHIICSVIEKIAIESSPRGCVKSALKILDNAITNHDRITETGIQLRDSTNIYQKPWRSALQKLHDDHDEDFEFLEEIY